MSWDLYLDACARNDIFAAFEAMADIGLLPVVLGADAKGKLKRPMAMPNEPWQHVSTDQWKARLIGYLQNGIPVGIGCKPVGYLVCDIDPQGKDRTGLAQAWKEASQLLYGLDDFPETLIIKTEAGCHVWFEVTDKIMEAWPGLGRRAIDLPSGGKLELFVGIKDVGMQVACAPTEGKSISLAKHPIKLSSRAEKTILKELSPKEKVKHEPAPATADKSADLVWITKAMDGGYLDSELDDYNRWLSVGMALNHRFGEEGVELWEKWSSRHAKHVDGECALKVRTFKRNEGRLAVFGKLVKVVRSNGGPDAPPIISEGTEIEIDGTIEAANTADIRRLMKDREWVWGDKERNVGWFVQRGLHLVEGKEGTGKTRFIIDLVRRWALDLTWPDNTKTTISPTAKVLFVASDSHWDQIAMTAEAFGLPDENVIFTGPQDDPYNFTNLDDPQTLAMIRHWCDKYEIGMVVIDTLMAASARPLVDPQEVAKIAGPLREIAREKNVAVVMIGHLNSQGETWGRAMGRACDNVIRMEADENDEQSIIIKSVKSRWNRFELPLITGRQMENGWEYVCTSKEAVLVTSKSLYEQAIAKTLIMFSEYPHLELTKKGLRDELVERGVGESTAYRYIEKMVYDEVLLEQQVTRGGKDFPLYSLRQKTS